MKNIGSNRDLFQIMRQIHNELGLDDPGHVPAKNKCIVVDCNIFSRVFKVRDFSF